MKVAVWKPATGEVIIEDWTDEKIEEIMIAIMDGAQVLTTPDESVTITDGNQAYTIRRDNDERAIITTIKRITEAGGVKIIDRTAH